MGAGASACEQTVDTSEVLAACSAATKLEIQECVAELDAASLAKLSHALELARRPLLPEAIAVEEKSVTAAVLDEDGVDAELAIELSKQEALFLKCLRKRAERQRLRKLEREEKRAAAKAARDKALEAAFDNEVDSLLSLFDQGVEPDCCDEHGTTPLSEAAGAGAEDVAEVLLGEGCDPNSIGRYRRTPLWRAAYAGNARMIRLLLRSGSDPRDPDEQGARPIDVASTPESRELLLCWDTSATERIQKESAALRKQSVKQKASEEAAKSKRQEDELNEAIEEAKRKHQIARSELAQSRRLMQDYRHQKVSLAECGESAKLAELEPLLEGAEVKTKLFEASVQEWEWKISRAKLKQSDFRQAERERADKKAGKVQGFRIEVVCDTREELDALLPHLNNDLEVTAEYKKEAAELTRGDSMIKSGAFEHLRKSEFTKRLLVSYGREGEEAERSHERGRAVPLSEPANAEDVVEARGREEDAPAFPLALSFTRGFNRTIAIKSVADVLIKDIGGLRREDGRWPLVIDPSGRTSTFVQYTGASVFSMAELIDMDPLRLRRALLNNLLNGGVLVIDLSSFDFPVDVVEEQFGKVEKGLFKKLADRSVLYSYLLPRRFRSLILKELSNEFPECAFMDDHIEKFVLAFVTSVQDPSFDFAKQFYTVYVRGSNDDDEAA